MLKHVVNNRDMYIVYNKEEKEWRMEAETENMLSVQTGYSDTI